MIDLIGQETLKRLPSLKTKRWAATRWLSRSECMKAICDALHYLLDHLRLEMTINSKKETREHAAGLYNDLTDYNNFMFIFYYKEVAETIAITTKKLQYRDIQISDVGRYVLDLCRILKKNYPQNSRHPEELMAKGYADKIVVELFGEDPLNSKICHHWMMLIL